MFEDINLISIVIVNKNKQTLSRSIPRLKNMILIFAIIVSQYNIKKVTFRLKINYTQTLPNLRVFLHPLVSFVLPRKSFGLQKKNTSLCFKRHIDKFLCAAVFFYCVFFDFFFIICMFVYDDVCVYCFVAVGNFFFITEFLFDSVC